MKTPYAGNTIAVLLSLVAVRAGANGHRPLRFRLSYEI